MPPSNFVKIKDPIYGYIEIDENDVVKSIINSALFHRLENVIQTSYTAVYPSSVHNRFIHSIGVYYLGSLAIEGIKKNCSEEIKNELGEYENTFKLACLLHDLGHSPFSHTGEVYYDNVKETQTPWDRLMRELSDDDFNRDGYDLGKHPGAAHERMSALEAVIYFKDYIEENQRSFFARCIIGLKYKDKTDIRNCFIELLNSSTIDVDKLDYLIRDSYFTGFKSVTIDYERLLGSVCIVKNDEEDYILGFTKSGLSTLESVILAHDMERKWIQGHPIIQYECFLLDSIIYKIVKEYKDRDIELFSLDALTSKGLLCGDGKVIRFLSDADILSIAKNELYGSDAVQEFFNRDERRKSLWKTESEYRFLVENNLSTSANKKLGEIIDSLQKSIDSYREKCKELPLIDDDFLNYLEEEIQKSPSIDKLLRKDANKKKKTLSFIKKIKEFSSIHGYKFDYCLRTCKQFKSSFNKDALKEAKIIFKDNEIDNLGSVVNLFEQMKPVENFFYFYVNPKDYLDFDTAGFVDVLRDFVNKEC